VVLSSSLLKPYSLEQLNFEQNVIRALRLAVRVVILHNVDLVFDGSAKEILDNKKLREQFLAI
jgi:branched-chain amino acid transport system ATP-binding protein